MMKIISLALLLILLLIRCNNNTKSKEDKSNNNLMKANSDFRIDSAFVDVFYKDNRISDSIQKEATNFYRRRHFKPAWFNKNGLNYAVSIFHNQLQNYRYNFADSSFYNTDLDSLIIEAKRDELKFILQQNKLQKLDLLLTTTFFKYAKKAYGGQAKNLSDLEWFIPRQNKNYQSTLDSLVLITNLKNEQIPLNKGYFLLKYQLKKYRDIEKNGGFPKVFSLKNKYQIGNSDSNLVMIKKYFYLTGDLKNNDKTIVFTDSLLKAIKIFQQRMGLVVNDHLDSITILELNKPISFRIKQIIINMERLRWFPVEMEKDYLLINIPEFKLYVFKNAKQVWLTNIVVGKSATQTSIFKDNVSQIILNPYWGVPQSIANNEILPHLKKNANYLNSNNMEVLSSNKIVNPFNINWNNYESKVPFTFRQKPSKNNALGKIKFLFPNSYDIYLHDTPSKHLFDDNQRAFSHGCIRVSDPKKLAMYLLSNDGNWNLDKINKILKTDKETTIKLTATVPIYIVYFTTWIDSAGQLNFRNDVYDLDKKLFNEMFGEQRK